MESFDTYHDEEVCLLGKKRFGKVKKGKPVSDRWAPKGQMEE